MWLLKPRPAERTHHWVEDGTYDEIKQNIVDSDLPYAPSFHLGAGTGRMVCSQPNLSSIPKIDWGIDGIVGILDKLDEDPEPVTVEVAVDFQLTEFSLLPLVNLSPNGINLAVQHENQAR